MDAMIDPQVLIEAVRDPGGQVVDFTFRSANRAALSYLGLGGDEVIGGSALKILPSNEGPGLLSRFAQCLADGEPVSIDDYPYFNGMRGEVRRYDVRAARAGADLLVLTWSDVTERFQYMQRIAASEATYRLVAENAGDLVCHTRENDDGSQTIVWISPNVEAVLGAPPHHWVGRTLLDYVAPRDARAHVDRWRKVSEGRVFSQRVRIASVDGVPHWFYVRAKPFYDAAGNRDGAVVAAHLVDDEVAAEQAVEKARRDQARADERYRRSMKYAAVGMCLAAPDGRFADVNEAMCRFFGYDAETLTQKTFRELTAPEYLDADLENVNELVQGRIDSFRMTKQYLHADGRRIWGDLSVSCIRDEHGQVENFIAHVIDITAQVEANERVRVLVERLQRSTAQVAEELGNAATYMTSILPRGLTGEVGVSSRYLPARELGGDIFDYRWIDDDHLLVYLIDVSGHGIAPALLSASIHNMLRFGNLAPANLLEPDTVLTELNRRFQMDQHGYHYFTMWYGVYEKRSHVLRYSSAGAPPALAFNSATGSTIAVTTLATNSAPVGMFEDTVFTLRTYPVPPGCQILVHSDGASEITLADEQQLSLKDFKNLASRLARSPNWSLDGLIDELHTLGQSWVFEDDCSLIQLTFPRFAEGKLEYSTPADTDRSGTQVEIDARRAPLGAIHAGLDALWSSHPGVPYGVRMQMTIATEEVGANIVEHTGRGGPLRIRMNAALLDDQVHVEFTDDGPPAAVDLTSVTMPDPMAERGRGLAMARVLLDRLAYRRDESGNHWMLVSKRFA